MEGKELFSSTSLDETEFSWQTALSLTVASKLSYFDKGTVQTIAKDDWGLDTCTFIDAADTQCFVASIADTALVAFRGTKEWRDWLINIKFTSIDKEYGTVHRGFVIGFDQVKSQLEEELNQLSPSKVLITGHSLGGALATIAAAEWRSTFPVSGVYTLGQPAVGRGEFAAVFSTDYKDKFFRFVNDDDVVAKVPPNYRHIGKLFRFDGRGALESQLEALESMGDGDDSEIMSEEEFEAYRETLIAEQAENESPEEEALEGMFISVSDHTIDNYIRVIQGQTA